MTRLKVSQVDTVDSTAATLNTCDTDYWIDSADASHIFVLLYFFPN